MDIAGVGTADITTTVGIMATTTITVDTGGAAVATIGGVVGGVVGTA